MGLIDWLEKRFGHLALPNLTLWFLVGQVMAFVAQYVGPLADGGLGDLITERLALDPQAVFAGQWWRLLTFPFLAPLNQFLFLVIFYFYFFYLIGTTLEHVWGDFRFNVFLGMGYVATVAGAFLTEAFSPGFGTLTYEYVFGSMFLAFARLYPDFQIMLFFILPVKIKWCARFQWFCYALIFLLGAWQLKVMVVAAVANYLFFYGKDIWVGAKQGHRRTKLRANALKASQKPMHECRVCGLTSQMAPKMGFRYRTEAGEPRCYCLDCLKGLERVEA